MKRIECIIPKNADSRLTQKLDNRSNRGSTYRDGHYAGYLPSSASGPGKDFSLGAVSYKSF